MSGPDIDFHSLSGSVIQLEQMPPDYGAARRRLRVIKVRGVPFLSGYHNFRIEQAGLRVFERLTGFDRRESQGFRRLESGIPALDQLLGGGLEEGTTCLMAGPSGAGKSTLASVFAHAAAQRGEHAAIFLFDERPETFQSRSEGVGYDLKPFIEQSLIQIAQLDPAQITPGEFAHSVRKAVEDDHSRVIVIDSLTGYFNAMPQDSMLTAQMHDLLNFMSRRGVLSILIVAQQEFLTMGAQPTMDISYLSDSILVLRLFEFQGSVRRCIAAIKKRAGEHETSIRELQVSPEGVTIGEPLTQFRNILTGHPEPVPKADLEGRG
jgi:circadian clock protein KaiC